MLGQESPFLSKDSSTMSKPLAFSSASPSNPRVSYSDFNFNVSQDPDPIQSVPTSPSSSSSNLKGSEFEDSSTVHAHQSFGHSGTLYPLSSTSDQATEEENVMKEPKSIQVRGFRSASSPLLPTDSLNPERFLRTQSSNLYSSSLDFGESNDLFESFSNDWSNSQSQGGSNYQSAEDYFSRTSDSTSSFSQPKNSIDSGKVGEESTMARDENEEKDIPKNEWLDALGYDPSDYSNLSVSTPMNSPNPPPSSPNFAFQIDAATSEELQQSPSSTIGSNSLFPRIVVRTRTSSLRANKDKRSSKVENPPLLNMSHIPSPSDIVDARLGGSPSPGVKGESQRQDVIKSDLREREQMNALGIQGLGTEMEEREGDRFLKPSNDEEEIRRIRTLSDASAKKLIEKDWNMMEKFQNQDKSSPATSGFQRKNLSSSSQEDLRKMFEAGIDGKRSMAKSEQGHVREPSSSSTSIASPSQKPRDLKKKRSTSEQFFNLKGLRFRSGSGGKRSVDDSVSEIHEITFGVQTTEEAEEETESQVPINTEEENKKEGSRAPSNSVSTQPVFSSPSRSSAQLSFNSNNSFQVQKPQPWPTPPALSSVSGAHVSASVSESSTPSSLSPTISFSPVKSSFSPIKPYFSTTPSSILKPSRPISIQAFHHLETLQELEEKAWREASYVKEESVSPLISEMGKAEQTPEMIRKVMMADSIPREKGQGEETRRDLKRKETEETVLGGINSRKRRSLEKEESDEGEERGDVLVDLKGEFGNPISVLDLLLYVPRGQCFDLWAQGS